MLRKALRGIGIALILMPEPFTTPIGLLLLGIALLLKNRRVSQRYLRGLIKLYLNQTRPRTQPAKTIHHSLDARLAELNSLWQPSPSKKTAHHVIDGDRLRLKFGARLNILETKLSNKATGSQATPEKAVHHSLESRWAGYDWLKQSSTSDDRLREQPVRRPPQRSPFAGAPGPSLNRPDGPDGSIPRQADKVIYHSLIQDLSGYVLPSVPMAPKEPVQHTVDMSRLQPYYQSKMAEITERESYAPGNRRKPERIILRRAAPAPRGSPARTANPWEATAGYN